MKTILLAMLGLGTGCSLLTSLGELESADGAAPDGSASDAPASDALGSDAIPDVVAADVDAGAGSLVTNGGFEQGTGGCGTNWGNGYNMTFTRVSPGRTGSSACMVCVQPSATGSYALEYLVPIPVDGGSYYAEAWLMTPDGGVAADPGILVSISGDAGTFTGCVGTPGNCQGSFFNPPVGSWQVSSATFGVAGSGDLHVQIHSYQATPGSCFVVDDIALYAQ